MNSSLSCNRIGVFGITEILKDAMSISRRYRQSVVPGKTARVEVNPQVSKADLIEAQNCPILSLLTSVIGCFSPFLMNFISKASARPLLSKQASLHHLDIQKNKFKFKTLKKRKEKKIVSTHVFNCSSKTCKSIDGGIRKSKVALTVPGIMLAWTPPSIIFQLHEITWPCLTSVLKLFLAIFKLSC